MTERKSQIEAVQTHNRLTITMADGLMGRPSVLFDSGENTPFHALLDPRFDFAGKLRGVGCSPQHIVQILLDLAKGGEARSTGESAF